MDTLEIVKALKSNVNTKHHFRGVFASDQLPKLIRQKPACLVVNTDTSKKPGTHWVAVFIPRLGPCEYFDSFGFKPQVKSILKFVSSNSKNFVHNKKQLQSVFSTICGNYCCEFLLHRCQGKSMTQFVRMYDANKPSNNDLKTLRHFKLHFNKIYNTRNNAKTRLNKKKHV